MFTVHEWTLDVRWLLHARIGRCQIARRAGNMPELQDRDKQNFGIAKSCCRESRVRIASGMSVLRQGVSAILFGAARGGFVR